MMIHCHLIVATFVVPSRTPPPSPRNSGTVMEAECHWEPVHDTRHSVMKNYFNVEIEPDSKCELFCIEGVPAASAVYDEMVPSGDPHVSAFYLNKGLVLMFDAGPQMRKQFFKRHPSVYMRDALNRNDFLMF